MKKIRLLVTACAFSLLVVAWTKAIVPAPQFSKATAGFNEKYRQREVVVRLKQGANITAIRARYGISTIEKSREVDEYRLDLPSDSSVVQKLTEMAADPDLVFAAPNFIYRSP